MAIKYTLKWFVCCLLLGFLGGCGGGGETSTKSADSSKQDPSTSSPTNTVSALLNLLIPAAVSAEIPTGSTATVNVKGQGVNLTKNIDDTAQAVDFAGLLLGDYTVTVIVTHNGTEIGTYKDNVTLTSSGLSVEANITFNRASLVVEPVVKSDYSSLNYTYEGIWNVGANRTCIDPKFDISSANTIVNLSGDDISLTINAFFGPNIILTGKIDDTSGRLTASGTYESSDFTSGTWVVANISKPSANSIFFKADLVNQTDDNCSIAIEYVGFKSPSLL